MLTKLKLNLDCNNFNSKIVKVISKGVTFLFWKK